MRRSRGQAVVELALGAIVFVMVLMAGIHLAEVAQLSLKVQEAEAFAVWDASGRRVQRRGPDGSTDTTPFNATLSHSGGAPFRARWRYRDFDGLSSAQNGATIRYALTQGRGVDVRCDEEPSVAFAPTSTASKVLLDRGGLRCRASASIEAIRIPRAFLQREDSGFFREEPMRREPIPVCGTGFAVSGACRGGLAVLTNDWGLVAGETEQCRLDCRTSVYRGTVEALWAGGGTAGADLARAFAGAAPTDANQFHFSYSGIESDYFDYVGGEGIPSFRTGGPAIAGGMVEQHHTEGRCFLGRKCPP